MTPFIQPHQFNFIRNQLKTLLKTVYFVGDYRVYDAVKCSVKEKIDEEFTFCTVEQQVLFDGITAIRGQDEVNSFLNLLKPYVVDFPVPTEQTVKRLFKKVKKLNVPDLELVDPKSTTYFGWRDVSSRSIFLLVYLDGILQGLECKYSVASGSGGSVCTLCGQARQGDEVGLVVAVTKAKNYRSVGTYMCLDYEKCNDSITRLDELSSFVARVNSH